MIGATSENNSLYLAGPCFLGIFIIQFLFSELDFYV